MTPFRYLHLSDLHQGMRGQDSLWPNVRQPLFDDLSKLSKTTGPWDAVFFTGDFTQCGKKEEFTEVTAKFKALWDHLRTLGSTPVLLPAPGNHDLVRPDPKHPYVKALATWENDPEISDCFWRNSQPGYREVVDLAFANYREWSAHHDLPRPVQFRPGLLPGDFVATIEKDPLRIGIVGLNSAFLQLADAKQERRLALGIQQIHEACDGDLPAWIRKHHLCILLTHHPVDWLLPQSQEHFRSEIAPAGDFALHLFGHMHEGRTANLQISGSNTIRSWQGYSLFGVEGWGLKKQERIHGYTAGVIEFEHDVANVRIWPRKMVVDHSGARRFVPDPQFVLSGDCIGPERLTLHRPIVLQSGPACMPEQQSQPDVEMGRSTITNNAKNPPAPDTVTNRAVKTLTERPAPIPRFVDEETRNRLKRLEELRKKKQEFIENGWSIDAIDADIRKEIHELRAGGRLNAGELLGERYKLINRLGEGGYGTVWDAYDLHTRDHVAVKVLHSNVAGDPYRVARFFRGAETMDKLNHHPAVVKIIQKWGDDDGFFYYAMKKYTGGNLEQALQGEISDEQIIQIIAYPYSHPPRTNRHCGGSLRYGR
jgi:hypothetical protein